LFGSLEQHDVAGRVSSLLWY